MDDMREEHLRDEKLKDFTQWLDETQSQPASVDEFLNEFGMTRQEYDHLRLKAELRKWFYAYERHMRNRRKYPQWYANYPPEHAYSYCKSGMMELADDGWLELVSDLQGVVYFKPSQEMLDLLGVALPAIPPPYEAPEVSFSLSTLQSWYKRYVRSAVRNAKRGQGIYGYAHSTDVNLAHLADKGYMDVKGGYYRPTAKMLRAVGSGYITEVLSLYDDDELLPIGDVNELEIAA